MIRKYLFNSQDSVTHAAIESVAASFDCKPRSMIPGFASNFFTPYHIGTYSLPDAYAAIEFSYGTDFSGKCTVGVTAFHVERKVEPTIMVGVGKLLHEDEDFDEKVKEIIAAATALHPRKKVTV